MIAALDAGRRLADHAGMTCRSLVMPSPLGPLTLVARGEALAAVLWPGDDPARVPIGPTADAPDDPLLTAAAGQIAAYLAGARRGFDLPVDPVGTPFQQAVWAALVRIPYGETRSYAALAAAIGRPEAVRAVGAANGRNPLSIICPCHRVVGAGGSLTGFAGGLAAKRWLLALEAGQAALF